jgi:hypothetical protein
MMDSQSQLTKARRSLDLAEQVLIRTYPVVNEPKLVLAVAEDILSALETSLAAFLTFHRKKAGSFEEALSLFRPLAQKGGFGQDDMSMFAELHDIIIGHKDSPVEFARKGEFVICDDAYHLRRVSEKAMKDYLFRAKLFVDKVSAVVKE